MVSRTSVYPLHSTCFLSDLQETITEPCATTGWNSASLRPVGIRWVQQLPAGRLESVTVNWATSVQLSSTRWTI